MGLKRRLTTEQKNTNEQGVKKMATLSMFIIQLPCNLV
jgi:hypothetical protein